MSFHHALKWTGLTVLGGKKTFVLVESHDIEHYFTWFRPIRVHTARFMHANPESNRRAAGVFSINCKKAETFICCSLHCNQKTYTALILTVLFKTCFKFPFFPLQTNWNKRCTIMIMFGNWREFWKLVFLWFEEQIDLRVCVSAGLY